MARRLEMQASMLAVATALVCAVIAADAVASLVEAEYLDLTPKPRPDASPPVLAAAPKPLHEDPALGDALVARNMFCSSCAPVITPGADPGVTFQPAAELIATSVGAADPVATVRVPASEVQGQWGVGDVIPGVGLVERIGFVSIDVRTADGKRGTLSLLGGRSDGVERDSGAATSAPVAAAPDPSDGRIRKIADTTFEVDRALIRELVSGNPQAAGARISPVAKDGKLDGLRLFGVRPAGLAAAIGLANADVIQAINNTRIESANTLLDILAQLDKLQQVELAGTRRGKPLTITLRLR